MSEATTISTAAPLLEGDLPCCKCRYNLRTISQAAVCPECGTAVATSLDFQKQWASLDLQKFFRGVLILAILSACGLLLSVCYWLFSSNTIFRTGTSLLSVALGVFHTVGVVYLAYSKPSIDAAYRFLAIFISVLTWAINLIDVSITLGYAALNGTAGAPLNLPIEIYVSAMSTFLGLIPLALGWILLNDFAVRTGRRSLIGGTHITFAVYTMESIYHLIFFAVVIFYYLDFGASHFPPGIIFHGMSLVSLICSALFTIYWCFVAATAGKLRHFFPPEELVAIHMPPPG